MSHIRMYKAITLIVSSLLAGCAFLTGSMDITATDDRIMIEMEHVTGTTRQCFQLNSDRDIRISFIDLSGNTKIQLIDPEKNVIYEGNGSKVTDFTCHSTTTGEYELIVEAGTADGTILLSFPHKAVSD